MDIKRTVEILFQGNDQASKVMRSIGKNASDMGAMIESAAQPFARMADAVLVADAALAALAIGGMALAIDKASEFESSFAEISTLIDDTDENILKFKDDIITYARDSVKSLDDINGAVYTAISAGIDYTSAIESLNEAEKLSVAGKGDLNDTIRLVASTLNAYGEDTDQATRYSNAFFNAVKLGQTTLPELANSLSRVTGIASSAGIPIEDLTAAVAALTAAGMPTTEAMTGLKAVISSILAPSEEAKKVFNSLNIEYGEGALKAKGLDGVLAELAAKTGGNADQMKKLLGGIEGLNAGLILAEDKTGKYASALEQMRSGQDVVTEAFEKMADTIENVNQKLSNNLDILLIQVGDQLTGAYTGIADGIIEIFKGMQDAVEAGAFAELFAVIEEWAKRVEDFLKTVAANLPEAFEKVDFDDFIDALQSLGGEIGDLFDGIDLTTPEGLAEAIQAAVDTITTLITVTQGMVEGFAPIFLAIREGVSDFNAMGESAQIEFGKVLAAAKLVVEAGVLVAGAIAAIGESGVAMEDVFNTVTGAIQFAWNILQTAFDSAVLVMAEFLDKLLRMAEYGTLLIGPFTDVDEKIKAARESVAGFIEAVKENQFQNMSEAVEGGARAFSGLKGEATQAKEAAAAAGEAVNEAFPEEKKVDISIDDAGSIDKAAAELEEGIPPEKETKVTADVDAGSVASAKIELDNAIPEEQTSTVQIELDDGSLLLTNEKITNGIPEATQSEVIVELDDGSVLLTNQTLDAEIPEDRQVAIKAEVDKEALKKSQEYLIKEMETQADLLKTEIEWTAKVDIAAINAEAEKVKATFEATSSVIESTGEVMETIFQEWQGLDFQGRWQARKALEQELEIQKEQHEIQKKMAEEQIKLLELKRETIERGEGLIKVDSSGLEPALELVMWQILAKVQVRATEDAAQFLLGL